MEVSRDKSVKLEKLCWLQLNHYFPTKLCQECILIFINHLFKSNITYIYTLIKGFDMAKLL